MRFFLFFFKKKKEIRQRHATGEHGGVILFIFCRELFMKMKNFLLLRQHFYMSD